MYELSSIRFLKHESKQEKGNKSTMTKNVIDNGKITTRRNKTILSDKSSSIQFYGQWR